MDRLRGKVDMHQSGHPAAFDAHAGRRPGRGPGRAGTPQGHQARKRRHKQARWPGRSCPREPRVLRYRKRGCGTDGVSDGGYCERGLAQGSSGRGSVRGRDRCLCRCVPARCDGAGPCVGVAEVLRSTRSVGGAAISATDQIQTSGHVTFEIACKSATQGVEFPSISGREVRLL